MTGCRRWVLHRVGNADSVVAGSHFWLGARSALGIAGGAVALLGLRSCRQPRDAALSRAPRSLLTAAFPTWVPVGAVRDIMAAWRGRGHLGGRTNATIAIAMRSGAIWNGGDAGYGNAARLEYLPHSLSLRISAVRWSPRRHLDR